MNPRPLPRKPARAAAVLALAALAACAPVHGPAAAPPPLTGPPLAPPPRLSTPAAPEDSAPVPPAPAPAPPPERRAAAPAPAPTPGSEPPGVPPALVRLEAVSEQPFLTRSQLALLLAALPQKSPEPEAEAPIMTDILDHPAMEAILGAVRAGYLRPYPNHRFKPEGLLTRAELAGTLCRVLDDRPGARSPGRQVEIVDVPATNRFHAEIRRVTALGIMTTDEEGSFRPTGVVSGKEGWQAVLRLAALLGGRG